MTDDTTSGNPLGPYQQHTREEVVSDQLHLTQAYASGELSPGGDILKDGASDVLTAQMALIDLKEAIHPPRCEECGHGEEMSLGDVEHCLLQAQDAIRSLGRQQWDQRVQELFTLLWDSRNEFGTDWVLGLRQCPQKGWAGLALLEMRDGRVKEAWGTLHTALRGEG